MDKFILDEILNDSENTTLAKLSYNLVIAKLEKNCKEFDEIVGIFGSFLAIITEKYNLNPTEVGKQIEILLCFLEKYFEEI